jgi:hypothetical protein
MATFDDVIRLTQHLPEVTVSTSFATPALKVRGKAFCRMWGERDVKKSDIAHGDVLVVFCDLDEKPFLLAENPDSLFTAAHYDGHGSVLVLLDEVNETLLGQLLLDSYVLKAPPTIQRQFPPG